MVDHGTSPAAFLLAAGVKQEEMEDPMKEEPSGTHRLRVNIEGLVDDAVSTGEAIGKSIEETLRGLLSKRESVVMVRINKESLAKLDDLIDAGLVNSRSEAAAFLIGEGVKSRSDLFDKIADKVQEIRKAKEELRALLDEPDAQERT